MRARWPHPRLGPCEPAGRIHGWDHASPLAACAAAVRARHEVAVPASAAVLARRTLVMAFLTIRSLFRNLERCSTWVLSARNVRLKASMGVRRH
eukprot:365043-Chlamydomonas_euryale.AAC.7